MSLDRSTESLNSPSKDNFVPFASYKWSRSNTVRKVNSTPTYTNEEVIKRTSVDDIEVNARRVLDHLNVEHCGSEKLRKYLSESTYRQSLESISEYKAKNSFASQRPPSSSFESLSSDCTDYVLRTATADANNKSTLLSESSSYLSWIESLNSENCTAAAAEAFATADAKAGEWNNFWLNYNNARNLYLQQQNSCSCNSMSEHAAGDEFLDAASRISLQKEPSVELSSDLFYMTRSDMMETIKCCQQIIEILQTAMNKTLEHTRSDVGRQQNRTVSVDSSQRYSLPNMQKNKYNPPNKSNLPQTGSCINALFNSGVTDLLKRVIMKRRDSSENQAEVAGIPKAAFSNWNSNNRR